MKREGKRKRRKGTKKWENTSK